MKNNFELPEINYIWKDRKRTLFGLPWSFTKYMLSEDRLFISSGLFTSKEDEVRLYRILDLELKRTLGQKLFGVGSISVHSSDKSLKDFVIKNIKNPRQVKELISQAVESERDKKRVVNRELMADHSCDSDDFDDDSFFDHD